MSIQFITVDHKPAAESFQNKVFLANWDILVQTDIGLPGKVVCLLWRHLSFVSLVAECVEKRRNDA